MWLAIFGLVFLGERLPRAGVIGIAVGVVGVAILAWPTARRRRPRPGRPARAARLPGLLGARRDLRRPAGGPAGARAVRERPRDDRRRPRPAGRERGHRRAGDVRPGRGLDRELDRHRCTCSLVGSLVGYTTFAWLVQVAPLPRVATYAYVNPVVAVILGAIVLQEPLSPRTWVASVVIVAAVVLIVTAAGARPAGRGVGRAGTRRARRRPGLGAGRRLRPGRPRQPRVVSDEHRPRDAPRPDHRRDHRVDPERRREQRGVADVEPADDRVAARTRVRRRGPGPTGRTRSRAAPRRPAPSPSGAPTRPCPGWAGSRSPRSRASYASKAARRRVRPAAANHAAGVAERDHPSRAPLPGDPGRGRERHAGARRDPRAPPCSRCAGGRRARSGPARRRGRR